MKRRNRVQDAGANSHREVANIEDLMTESVMTVTRHQTLDHAKLLMSKHRIHSMPVTNDEREPVGIITSSDLLNGHAGETLIGQVMSGKVHTVSRYSAVSVAARMMRKRKIHHLVVTDKKKVVGVISSFDLLRLVEDKHFVMKNPPTTPKRGRKTGD
jgi:CBS domain-containing protein